MNASLSSLRRLPGAGRVLRALGVGGEPPAGYFAAGWSLGTLLLLYWLETILVTLLPRGVLPRKDGRSFGEHYEAGIEASTPRPRAPN